MPPPDIWASNRAILCHFDSYSAQLLFAWWDGETVLLPQGLPESAREMPAPADVDPQPIGEQVRRQVVERLGTDEKSLVRLAEFSEWIGTEEGPLHIHVLRFNTFEAPGAVIEAHAGQFKAISALRRASPLELPMLRRVFDIVIGGAGHRVGT